MNNAKAKQPPVINQRQGSYALEEFKKFIDRHLVEGEHEVRMFLDPQTNYFAICCLMCEPRMIDLMETRH